MRVWHFVENLMYWLSVPAVVSLWPWPYLCTMGRIRKSQGQGQRSGKRGLFVCFVVRLADYRVTLLMTDDRSWCVFPLDFRDAVLFG